MDPNSLRAHIERMEQAGIPEALDRLREAGIVDSIHSAGEVLDQARQKAWGDPMQSVVQSLADLGMAEQVLGGESIAKLVLSNVDDLSTAAMAGNLDLAREATRDLYSVVEEMRRTWIGDPAGQSALKRAVEELSGGYYETVRRAMELAADPKVHELVRRVEREQLADTLAELEQSRAEIDLTLEDLPDVARREPLFTAKTISGFFYVLFFLYLAAMQASGPEAQELKEVVAALWMFCELLKAQMRDGE